MEKYNTSNSSWEIIDRAMVRRFNDYYVSVTKSFLVERGMSYRVRASHIVGMDNDYPYDSLVTFTEPIYIN